MPKKKKKNTKHRPSQRPEQKQTNSSWVIIVSTIFVLVLAFVIVAIVVHNKNSATTNSNQSVNQASTSDNQAVTRNIDYSDQPSLGKSDAPVKIVEFGDYKCPFCQRFELSIFPKIQKDYIDTGKVQFYFLNYILFGDESRLAAEASESIYHHYPDRFWNFHQLLYKNQGPEDKSWVTEDVLEKIAKQAVPNLNVSQLRSDMDHSTYDKDINKDMKMGGAGLGTPTLLINGKMLDSSLTFDYPKLSEQIDQDVNSSK